MRSKKGNPSKRIKLTESTRRELKEAQKQTEEQRRLRKYWKKQTQELRGNMGEERQVWEDKYKADTKKQSQEIMKLKIKIRAKKNGWVELQVENQSIWNNLHVMEQSLMKHKNYITELREENIYQSVQYERAFGEVERDKEVWKAQCLTR